MIRIKKFLHDLLHHSIWHAVVLPVFWIISTLIEYLQKKTVNQSFFDLFLEIGKSVVYNPLFMASLLLLVTFIRILFRLYGFAKNSWLRLKQLEALAHAVGLRSFSNHAESQKETDWEICKDTLDKSKASQLCILGAAGYETFSGPESPLYDYISQANCELRVLLLNPDSNAFKQRCRHINVTEKKYRDWIFKSVDFCKNLKDTKNIPVEVRLYDDYPIWKMIFTPEYMWLQWYQNKHVDQTHVYNFQTAEGMVKTSLYYPLTAVFRRRWDSGTAINLETWKKPTTTTNKRQHAKVGPNNSLPVRVASR